MKRHLSIIFLILVILLSSCAPVNKTIATPTQFQPAATLDRSTPTATEGIRVGITVIPPATWSPTPTTPAKTPRPASTPTFRKPTKTPDPNIGITEQAYERTATQIAGFPATCDQFYFDDILLSPNGTWMAIHCGYSHNQTLEVINQEGKQWIFHIQDFVAPNFIHDGEVGEGGLYPEHWTNDAEYLYFTSYIGFDGGGTCVYGFGVSGLFRLNVNTGAVSAVLKAKSSTQGYEIAFSPGGGKLAYISDTPAILDFRTGEKTIIDPGAAVAGDLVWSPDGSKLAFATCSPAEDFYTIKKSGIKIYSLETQELKTILEVEKNFLGIDKSEGNQKLKIVNSDIQTGKDDYFYYDWSSGRISTPSPTPQP
jgi:hypothetical protein